MAENFTDVGKKKRHFQVQLVSNNSAYTVWFSILQGSAPLALSYYATGPGDLGTPRNNHKPRPLKAVSPRKGKVDSGERSEPENFYPIRVE